MDLCVTSLIKKLPRRLRSTDEVATCKSRDIGHGVSSRRLERHMFLFTISMYIYVNGERGTRVRGGVGCRRRDANESRLCRRKFFHSPGKHIGWKLLPFPFSWVCKIIERIIGSLSLIFLWTIYWIGNFRNWYLREFLNSYEFLDSEVKFENNWYWLFQCFVVLRIRIFRILYIFF